jgi:NTE family protein
MNATDFTQAAAVRNLVNQTRERCKKKEFSDIIDDAGHQYVDLVMEGGGVLGIALVGYTYMLEEMGIRFLGIGGTSAGSINALLLASLGTADARKSEKVLHLLADMDMFQFVDGDSDVKDFVRAMVGKAGKFKLGFKAMQVLDTVEEDLGLNPGEVFRRWITDILRKEGITTTRDLEQRLATIPAGLRKRDGTPLRTREEAGCYLRLITADVTTETKVEFPRMAPLYWAAPESVDPAMYVRASMSIPFFFHPFQVDIPQGTAAWKNWEELAGYTGELPRGCAFIDGGIMSNFPIDLFHRPNRVPSSPTFGAKLGTDRMKPHRIEKPMQLAGAIFNSARHCLDYDFIARNPDYKRLVTSIDTGAHDWLNFELPDADKVDLFYRGARAAAEFLVGFDWAEYKEIRARLARAFVLANPSAPEAVIDTSQVTAFGTGERVAVPSD